jgi:uncharacterized membrane protein YfcA
MSALLGVPLIGWGAAAVIGLSLGLLGGGGSVLTVPTFTYLLGVETKRAIATSLPVVGLAAAAGAALHWRRGNVRGGALLAFAPAAMIGALLGTRAAERLPASVQVVVLAVVMVMAALAMLKPRAEAAASTSPPKLPLLLLVGGGVGVLTGVVGVGGGFLLVPALITLGGLATKQAIGTSLAVIALNSAAGTAGYLGDGLLDGRLVLVFGTIAVAGTLAGSALVAHVPAARLRQGFAVLLLAIGVLMLVKPA